ncbi:heterodisulfide reductase-related iron-sulfur binding cluster [Desulfuromonas sp. AOP6]|uniref:heterodisulfide reductase-related iron-sulfur binding cluster n=1 Tax=Desulfuromonas sp. AOP6 TaxID=1566351 RepID=UPI001287E070|nr:heterodisulfide reductase-related iron-sulfur binding cluster [Desulfuromonas sp. AOP6]BCA79956.1 electron transporter [Desulfuromonas sp. AOP6]
MEATREIYWNVGHGVVLPMYLLAMAAFGLMAWGVRQRLAHWRQGKPLNRFDRPQERLRRMVGEVLAQSKVARVREGGVFHALFFWGFVTLFVGTLLVMLQADLLTPVFEFNLLQGSFYLIFSLALDIAGAVAILMLAGLFVRRYLVKPAGLETKTEDLWLHGLLFAILITGFFIEGARMAATELVWNPELARFSPVGLLVAKGMSGLSPQGLGTLHVFLWWLHLLLALGFIAALPFTKLKHILYTSANAFFAPLEAKGAIATLNLEDEEAEQFGAATVADLTWKDLFDADACTSCKRCQDRCPAYITDKPLSPMKLIEQLGETAITGKDAPLVEAVGEEAIWSCTTCRACQDICPANNEHVNKIIELRRNLTLMEGAFPGDEVRTAISNLEVNGNPFGMAFAGRGDWAEGLDVARVGAGESADILYFAGCYASFDQRNREVARNFVRICQAAGVRVGILGKDEKCCGEPARKLGNEYLYQMLAQENVETLQASGVARIVTTCPHCFNTLSRDYRDLGLEVEVEHYTTYIHRLLLEGHLLLTPGAEQACTYHDSCYLGRYKDIVSEPREVLKAAGWQVTEMDQAGLDSFCCSAGGGRILAEEKLGSRINVTRVRQAAATEAPILVSNCPFCLTMFEDGIKTSDCEDRLKVRDLAEIVVERIGG